MGYNRMGPVGFLLYEVWVLKFSVLCFFHSTEYFHFIQQQAKENVKLQLPRNSLNIGEHLSVTVLTNDEIINLMREVFFAGPLQWISLHCSVIFSIQIVTKSTLKRKYSKLTLLCDFCVKVTLPGSCKASDMLIFFFAPLSLEISLFLHD